MTIRGAERIYFQLADVNDRARRMVPGVMLDEISTKFKEIRQAMELQRSQFSVEKVVINLGTTASENSEFDDSTIIFRPVVLDYIVQAFQISGRRDPVAYESTDNWLAEYWQTPLDGISLRVIFHANSNFKQYALVGKIPESATPIA